MSGPLISLDIPRESRAARWSRRLAIAWLVILGVVVLLGVGALAFPAVDGY